jgi:hypothetical protein
VGLVGSEEGPGMVKVWRGSKADIVGLIVWRGEGWRSVNMKWRGSKEKHDGPVTTRTYIED